MTPPSYPIVMQIDVGGKLSAVVMAVAAPPTIAPSRAKPTGSTTVVRWMTARCRSRQEQRSRSGWPSYWTTNRFPRLGHASSIYPAPRLKLRRVGYSVRSRAIEDRPVLLGNDRQAQAPRSRLGLVLLLSITLGATRTLALIRRPPAGARTSSIQPRG